MERGTAAVGCEQAERHDTLAGGMSAARVKPGDMLGGKYKVERVLGAGGMGVVVAARHVDLGQRVALKFMLKEAMTDPSHAERFLREAKAAVQLKSVHTAKVLDVGRLNNGEPYMVMEYLDGRDLDEELRRAGPMPPHVAVDFILQACEALAEAHGLGMIHRDIKTKNMFLTTKVDGRPLVKVLDFGLAKTIGGHNDVSLTATNSVFGSPQYMSPEQMRSAKDVDTRSDIWSIGVCLYELLTGHVPFDASGVAEICAMVLKDPVAPPSTHIAGLPADLEAAVMKCLEKDPTQRYQTIADLAFDLQPYAADEGSARRILQVMQTAQKVELPTIATMNMGGPHVPNEDGPKTISSWDSGERTRRTTRFKPWQMTAIVIALLSLMSVGVLLTVLALRARSRTLVDPTVASAPLTPPTDTTTTLTDEPLPTPAPTLLGASTPEDTPPASTDAPPAPASTDKPSGTSKPHHPNPPRTNTAASKPPPPASATTAAKPTATPTPTRPPGYDPGSHM